MPPLAFTMKKFSKCSSLGGRSSHVHLNRIRPKCQSLVRCEASPQRCIIILPGLGNASKDYAKMAEALGQMHDVHIETADVARIDWARNAAGLLDPNYWSGTLNPRPTVDWYLNRVDAAVKAAREAAPDVPITLLAHSAGGWLGRLYMLDFGHNSNGIDQFVTLGSPHLPPPEGVIDQTRGILTYVNEACPGAFHAPDVQYVTIAGKYMQGLPLLGMGNWSRRIVGAGYKQVCGDDTVYGDGIVPLPSAHLDGALQLTLAGAYHSPLGAVEKEELQQESAQLAAEDSDDYEVTQQEVEMAVADVDRKRRLWYGSQGVIEKWAGVLAGPDKAEEVVAAAALINEQALSI